MTRQEYLNRPLVSLMRLSYQRKIREMKMWSEQVAGMGRERQKNFLEYCQRMIRENFIFNLHQRDLTYMTTTLTAGNSDFWDAKPAQTMVTTHGVTGC